MEFTFFDIMKTLNTYIAPSGHEHEMLKFIKKEIEKYCDEASFDPMGNLIVRIGTKKGERVMFSAHSDTLGFIAYAIDDKGFVRVSSLGGQNLRTVMGYHVRFSNGTEGVLFYESPDGYNNLQKCYIDIGVSSKEEAEKMISIGSVCSIVGDVYLMGKNKDYIVSPFLDDRIACAIQMIAIKELWEEKAELKNEVYFVFSVQEEVGLRGAGPAAFNIDPVYGIAIDVTSVSDMPESGHLSQKIGDGACIKLMDGSVYCNEGLVRYLRKTAADYKIKTQSEILFAGGTDAGAIQRTRGGVYCGGISIPTRYIHSPIETASISDCTEIVKLIKASVKEGFQILN